MISRERALDLVRKYVKKENLVKHMIATGACMRRLAEILGEDEEIWEIAGILHDLDYERTFSSPEKHSFVTVEILREEGVEDERILNAILAHAGKKKPENLLEKAIYSVDPTTGFIVACALMHPSKSLVGLDVPFLLRRFKEKRFAPGANRDIMKKCEELGMNLEEFLGYCLEGMRRVKEELSL